MVYPTGRRLHACAGVSPVALPGSVVIVEVIHSYPLRCRRSMRQHSCRPGGTDSTFWELTPRLMSWAIICPVTRAGRRWSSQTHSRKCGSNDLG